MPVAELALVIEAIIEIAVEGTLDQAKHHEAVLKVRQKLRRKLGDPEPEFESVYAHTLIEYGIGKPRPLLEFFRYEFVRDAFEQAFHKRDWTLVEQEIEPFLESHQAGQELQRLEIDPAREIARFTTVFYGMVDLTRSPAEIRRDQTLSDMHQRLEKLDQLDTIHAEIATLAKRYERSVEASLGLCFDDGSQQLQITKGRRERDTYGGNIDKKDELVEQVVRLDIQVVNDGSFPANDIDIFLRFDDALIVYDEQQTRNYWDLYPLDPFEDTEEFLRKTMFKRPQPASRRFLEELAGQLSFAAFDLRLGGSRKRERYAPAKDIQPIIKPDMFRFRNHGTDRGCRIKETFSAKQSEKGASPWRRKAQPKPPSETSNARPDGSTVRKKRSGSWWKDCAEKRR